MCFTQIYFFWAALLVNVSIALLFTVGGENESKYQSGAWVSNIHFLHRIVGRFNSLEYVVPVVKADRFQKKKKLH